MHNFKRWTLRFLVMMCILSASLAVLGQDNEQPVTGRIVFTSDTITGKNTLMIMNADGSNPQALTQSDVSPREPSASPDSKQIVFVDTQSDDLFVVNADGSGQRRLTHGNIITYPTNTGWTADGREILFLSDSRQLSADFKDTSIMRNEIFSVTQDGVSNIFGEIPLTIYFLGNWSPDGKWMLVNGVEVPVKKDGKYFYTEGIYLISPDGAIQKVVNNTNLSRAVFSPNGKQIAYMYDLEAHVIDVDLTQSPIHFGNDRRVWNEFNASVLALAWSPDGTRLAIQVGLNTGGGSPGFIYSIKADGSDLQKLAATGGVDSSIAWLNDGTVSERAPGCTAYALEAAYLHSGADPHFAVMGKFSMGDTAGVTGQATDKDRKIWWQLESGAWVESTAINTIGNCDDIPVMKS